MADLFGCDSVSHRANADVDALCGVWRVLLVALTDLPQGLMARLADMHPDVPWSYRPIFSFLAGQNPGSIFSLSAARADVLKADRADDRVDADELPVLKMPSREEIEADYAPMIQRTAQIPVPAACSGINCTQFVFAIFILPVLQRNFKRFL